MEANNKPEDGEKSKGNIWIKLGLASSEDHQWYKPFKKSKKRKIPKFKLFILSLYLLIALGTLLLHPYLIIVLTNGFAPYVKQPAFAYAYKIYRAMLNEFSTKDIEFNASEQDRVKVLSEDFNDILHRNHLVLYLTLLALPINVFSTLCLAFRFTRRNMSLLVASTHFLLAMLNFAIISGIFTIYKLQDENRHFLMDKTEKIWNHMRDLEDAFNVQPLGIKISKDVIRAQPSSLKTYLFPIYGVLGVSAFLHLLLAVFFVIRYKTDPSSVKPDNVEVEPRAK
ncbi:hypothetical protein M3Y97_00530900 [Aphelenchoides bicaudatus]|nr:hypothetical protein M3Y97_00530900 [Aphelenchoides bicaudatus]